MSACGGGGGGPTAGGPIGGNNPPPGNSYVPGVFQPSSTFANQCASTTTQNHFLRSWTNEIYLWYNEVPDLDPASVVDPLDYFDELRTDAVTTSGQPKDKFHFTYDTDEWYQLSQSGVSAGYGVQWALLSPVPPRETRVAYTEPNSPASAVNLERGATVLAVDGVDIDDNTDAGIATLNEGLFSPDVGDTHSFTVQDLNGTVRTIEMTAANVTADPVQDVQVLDTPTGRVGYLVFNDHILTAENALVDAVDTLASGQGIDDLVLDIRYNGGGYLFIASQLSYMIAGNAQTAGRVFEEMEFNDKHPVTNPVTGEPLEPTPFYNVTTTNQALPSLGLSRVFVLTGPGTCSASEAIMNGLRGIGVEVIQIGSTTCGKPYGFYPEENCGTTYFTIQFRGVNEIGFGDYTDGFSAQNQASPGTVVPGCSVGDDFDHLLGNPNEARLAAALAYRDTGLCPAASGAAPPGFSKTGVPESLTDGIVPKPPHLTNRILTRWPK
ncbi:MAG TPA: S41 family peptidase [Woeseiaceae bacterium]|nr:S41 family peptidase [Woeseiaceae bacterium]